MVMWVGVEPVVLLCRDERQLLFSPAIVGG